MRLEGVVVAGSSKGPRIKSLLKISTKFEWNAYKEVVLTSEVRSLDLVVHRDCTVKSLKIELFDSLHPLKETGPSQEE